MRVSSYYYTLMKELQYHGIVVNGIVVRRKIAFMVLGRGNYVECNYEYFFKFNKIFKVISIV